jgi:hypothetical protein
MLLDGRYVEISSTMEEEEEKKIVFIRHGSYKIPAKFQLLVVSSS